MFTEPELIDLAKAEDVEVFVDHKHTLWINVDGKCLLRIQKVEHLTLDDPIRGNDNLW